MEILKRDKRTSWHLLVRYFNFNYQQNTWSICVSRRLPHVRPQRISRFTRNHENSIGRAESHPVDSVFYIGNRAIEILNLHSPKLRRFFRLLAASSGVRLPSRNRWILKYDKLAYLSIWMDWAARGMPNLVSRKQTKSHRYLSCDTDDISRLLLFSTKSQQLIKARVRKLVCPFNPSSQFWFSTLSFSVTNAVPRR